MTDPKTRRPLLVALVGFRAGTTLVPAGTIVDAGDPIVKGRESLFDKVENRIRNTRRA